MARKRKRNNNTGMIFGIGAAVAAAGAAAFFFFRAPKQPLLADDTRAREAEARAREAEEARKLREAELKALDRSVADRFLDFGFDTGRKLLDGLL
jgi:hypothetical protein